MTRFAAADETAMLALAAVQGDYCVRADQKKLYRLTGSNPSALADWTAQGFPKGTTIYQESISGEWIVKSPADIESNLLPGRVNHGSGVISVANGLCEGQATITDASVSTTSKVHAWLSPTTDNDENSVDMVGPHSLWAVPGSGSVTIGIDFTEPQSGNFAITYQVS